MGDHDSKQYGCTDLGNVERFVEQHRHHLKATGHKSAWFYWDGCRWKQSGERKAHSLANGEEELRGASCFQGSSLQP